MTDPRCKHKRKGIVTAGDPKMTAHAATNVCDRPLCIADAKAWAELLTGETATFKPDEKR